MLSPSGQMRKEGPEIDHYRVLPQTQDYITRSRATTLHYIGIYS